MGKNKEEIQEKYLELQTLNQQVEQLGEQLKALHQQVAELEMIDAGLEELNNNKNDETYVSLGSGVFAKAKLKDKDKILLNVGSNILVEKDSKDAKKVVETQVDGIKKALIKMENNMNSWNERIVEIQTELQGLVKEQ